MRQIKFRAWDGENKKMFNPSSISWKDSQMWCCDTKGENKLEYEITKPSSKLMQYTGLKDKNGVEIYEGDRVKVNSQYETDEPTIDCPAKVFFQEGSFRIDFHNMLLNQNFCSGHGNWNIEVIGNIYEEVK